MSFDYTPDEMARYLGENPWDEGIPEHILVGSIGFQRAVLGYRIDDLRNEIAAALPPSWRLAWNRLTGRG